MIPIQQAALEGLVGRELTPEEVVELTPLVIERNDLAIASILSRGMVSLQTKYIGTGTILATMDGQGGAFMDTLVQVGETNRDAYWAMDLIKMGRFDVGDQSSQNQIKGLAQAFPIFAEGLNKLMKLGQVSEIIHFSSVSDVLNKAMGIPTL